MNGLNQIFHRIDSFLFELIDKIKANPSYLKISESYSALDDDIRKILTQLISLSLIALPMLFVVIMLIINTNKQNDIDIKREVFSTANAVVSARTGLTTVPKHVYVPPANINANFFMNKLQQKYQNPKSANFINLDNIMLKDFEKEEITSKISTFRSEISTRPGKGVTIAELNGLLSFFTVQENFKITEVRFQRNNETRELEGSFKIMLTTRQR